MHLTDRTREPIGRVRHQHEVDVVGHQAIGPYLDRGLAAALGQEIAIEGVVGRFEEDLLAPIAALRHMMGNAGNNNAANARHKFMVAQSKSDCNG